MNLYEYQAKELFAAAGIPIQAARLVEDAAGVEAAVSDLALPCVLKAQILRGGRGKAGLIKMVSTAEDALSQAQAIFDSPHHVKRLLVVKGIDITQEFYLSLTIEPASAMVIVMVSASGGMDIETIAATSPEKIHREQIHPFHGIMPFNIRNIVGALGVSKDIGKQIGGIVSEAFDLFRKHDALLLEINPIAVTPDGECVAVDGKMIIDDAALSRQPFEHTAEEFTDPVEYEASEMGIPYVKMDGDIGLMCAGAGLTNTVSDLIYYYGGKPANFLEFGGPNYRRAKEAMTLALKSDPRVLLIVTFGTIARADVMAEGVTEAIRELKPSIPIVTAIRGTNEEEAANILRNAGLEPLKDTEEAVQKAIAIAGGGKK